MGLLGPLESFLCGPKSEKMSNVQRENDFFENKFFFWCLGALDGLHGFISASFGPIECQNGFQYEFEYFFRRFTAKC